MTGYAEHEVDRQISPEKVSETAPAAPPRRGTPRRWTVAHTAGVTTFDRDLAPLTTQNPVPMAGDTDQAYLDARTRKPKRSRALMLVTAQLIEAACHAKDGDSDGARAHIARAVELLDGSPGATIAGPTSPGPGKIPRGGFAAWQSKRLTAQVDVNLTGKIVISDLAASLHMSVGHFCRAFKRTFGMPARIWIRHRRIELAQGLMLTTDASLSAIALSCGMSDQSHFTRSFRRIVGETPSSWRQTRQGAIEERITELAYTAGDGVNAVARDPSPAQTLR